MGISASSLLDETKSSYIRDQVQAQLKDFSPYYRKQFSVARFSQVEDDLEQNKQKITQLLQQRGPPEEGEVLYEESVLFFDDTRKWRERYVVVRANYCLECHESLETFIKGVPPGHKLLPTGGTVLTTEESYMSMVDRCFPGDTGQKEDFAPPLSGMPGQFPVYLRLPYRRDSYFCFRQQAKQAAFISILSDCIRHQNQDFLKKKTCEVQAFLKAIQLYRQDRGKYESWDMLMGSDVRVMANLVMEQLLPSLEKDLLPRLKAKKTERKRVWFATVEAAYILVQEQLLEGLSALKDDCRTLSRQQDVVMHSDMDQILDSRRRLEDQIRAKVSEPAEKVSSESVQPYLSSILEELMDPVSSGFLEGRQLSEAMMDQVCQDILQGANNEQLKKALAAMARPNLLSCYHKISSLQNHLKDLQDRFGFSSMVAVVHSAQIDLQQLIENAAYTFELLLYKAVQDNPDGAGTAIEKVKHRVLKQYDYDSSSVRKRIFQDALMSITLPFMKRNLASTCRTELQGLDQVVYADHSDFIHVENVYESILLQVLDKEVTKVVKEAATLKKHNLFTDSRDLISQSSRSSMSSSPVSTPSSPALAGTVPVNASSKPPSPPVVNGVSSGIHEEKHLLQSEASADLEVVESLQKTEPKETAGQETGDTEIQEDTSVQTGDHKIQEHTSVQTGETEIQEDTSVQTGDTKIQEHASVQTGDTKIQEHTSVQMGDTKIQEDTSVQTRETEIQEETSVQRGDTEIQEDTSVQTGDTKIQEHTSVQMGDTKIQEDTSVQMGDTKIQEDTSVQMGDTKIQEHTSVQMGDTEIQEDTSIQTGDTKIQEDTPIQTGETEIQEDTSIQTGENEIQEDASTQTGATEASGPEAAEEEVMTSVEVAHLEDAKLPAEETGVQLDVEADVQPQISGDKAAAPSAREEVEDTSLKEDKADSITPSEPDSLDVSVGSEWPPSDLESTDEVSATCDVLKAAEQEPEPAVSLAEGAELQLKVELEPQETCPNPDLQPLDSVKEIRDLVVEVIEVQEPVQRYPGGAQ